MELNTGIILVLCNGELFAFKKEENMYKLYKKNINYKEYIYSMIELDESSFLIVCEISNFSNNFNTQCHFQIYDSKDILMTYNYCYKCNFIKNKYNVCKFNNDFILFCLYSFPFSNNYDMLFFNFRDKINFQFRVNMNHFQVYKIFNKSFLGLAYSNGKFYLNQIEITSLNNNNLNQNKGGVLIFNEEIDKNFIIEEMIIISDKKGKIKIYQIENQYFNLSEFSIETKIKERNERIKEREKKINNNNNNNLNIQEGDKTNINQNENKEKKYDNLSIIENKFNIIETEKTGNCLFDALGKAENISQLEMRRILTDYLKDNYFKIEGFELFMESNNDNIDNYIKTMKQPYEYGTNIEICAYSLLFKKNVIIHIIDDIGNGIGCINIGEENKLITYLLFISHSKGSDINDHYKLLKEKP